MRSYIVKVLKSYYITPDVKCFVVQKPSGYHFIPGQATEVSINHPEWKHQLRPFSFTCLKDQNYLEFMIKIYANHNGVTNKLAQINTGAELILHEVFGTIQYKGPGVFIAGGTGITPFISIFRDLYKNKRKLLYGNKLIYSNKTSVDVIMEPELKKMLKDNFEKIFTKEIVIGYIGHRINRDFLLKNIENFKQYFYICGSPDFVKTISEYLIDLGTDVNSFVIEK